MRLLRIRLTDVRGVAACEVDLARDGVTIVEAPNEAGKTTLFDAVDVLLGYKDNSRAQPVRSLQPVGRDVPSTIEVELTCGPTHLTCRKTFNRQSATELTIHAPRAEQLTGTAAHDRLRQILESEVDLDLYAALRFHQGRDLDAVPLQDSHVLAARLDAVAGGDGSAGGDDLLERVTGEFQRYFTPGGKPGRMLTQAEERVDRLEREHAEVTTRLADLAAASDELAGLDQELPALRLRLDDEVVPELVTLDAQLSAIDARTQAVAAREAEVASARQARDTARREREERQHAVADLQDLAGRIEELTARVAPDQVHRDELRATLAQREADLEEALATAASAQRDREAAQLTVDLLHARRDRDELASRLARVRELRDQADQARTALAGIQLDETRLDAIRTADQARRVAEATLQAGAPTVEVRARRSVDVDVDGAVHALDPAADEHRFTVADRFHLDIPDVVAVEVRAGGSAGDLQRERDRAVTELQRCCDDAGVADLADAERVARDRDAHQRALELAEAALDRELAEQTLDDLAAAHQAAADRVGALEGRVADDLAPDLVPAVARERLEAARVATQQAEALAAEVRAATEAVRAELTELTTRLASDEATLTGWRDQLARDRAALAAAREQASDDDLESAIAAAERHLAEREAALDEVRAELAALDPDDVQLRAQALREERDRTLERLTALGERRAALRERLEVAGAQGLGERALELEQQLERARADQRRVWARARAAELLHTELTTARDEVYRAYRAPLVERIVRQAQLLYGRRDGVAIELGDDLAIVSRTLDGQTLDWDQLSAGAREQLAILSALAAAQLAGSGGVPFVLDDALGYTDPGRLQRLGALLGRTTDAQVIVLTCVADRFRHVGNATTVRLLEATAAGSDPA